MGRRYCVNAGGNVRGRSFAKIQEDADRDTDSEKSCIYDVENDFGKVSVKMWRIKAAQTGLFCHITKSRAEHILLAQLRYAV